MPELPGRWLISSVITFGDHGETEAQRRIGLSLNMLFSLMKLYEFERAFSGSPRMRRFRRAPIPGIGACRWACRIRPPHGGLDVNVLAPIWKEAQKEPVVGPLACHLLHRLNADPSNLFRRIWLMRAGAACANGRRVRTAARCRPAGGQATAESASVSLTAARQPWSGDMLGQHHPPRCRRAARRSRPRRSSASSRPAEKPRPIRTNAKLSRGKRRGVAKKGRSPHPRPGSGHGDSRCRARRSEGRSCDCPRSEAKLNAVGQPHGTGSSFGMGGPEKHRPSPASRNGLGHNAPG